MEASVQASQQDPGGSQASGQCCRVLPSLRCRTRLTSGYTHTAHAHAHAQNATATVTGPSSAEHNRKATLAHHLLHAASVTITFRAVHF